MKINTEAKLRIHPAAYPMRIDKDTLQIRSIVGYHVTFSSNTDLIERLITFCDGSKNSAEIVESLNICKLRNQDCSQFVSEVINVLCKRNILINSEDEIPEDAFLQAIDFQSRSIRSSFIALQPKVNGDYIRMINDKFLQLEGQGAIYNAALSVAKDLGYTIVDKDQAETFPNVAVLCCDDSENFKFFRSVNRSYSKQKKRPLIFMYQNDMTIHMGPIVIPGQTACMECVFHRKRSNMRYEKEFDAYVESVADHDGLGNPPSSYAISLASFLLASLLGGIKSEMHTVIDPGNIITFNMLSLELEKNSLVRLPRCNVCGLSPETRPPITVRNFI